MTIEKKAWPELFKAVLDGRKTFDVRLADFNCQPGDTLVLKEWDPRTKEYTGRTAEKRVTFVFRTKRQPFWSEEEAEKHGFQIIAFT